MIQAQKAYLWTPTTSSRERDCFILDFQVEAGWTEQRVVSVVKSSSQVSYFRQSQGWPIFILEHWMGLLFGRGHPVNWPPWPSSLLERKCSSCPYQCWGYHFMGLWSHETRGWAGTNGNWRKKPEGSLWVGKEKEKCHSRLYFPSADFPWIVLFSPPHFPA